MPFGLDFKSIVIGAVIGYFVLPRVTGVVMGAVSSVRENVES